MKRLLLFLSVTAYTIVGQAQSGSEIFLFDLNTRKGKVVLSNGKNVTNHKGYDNQPFFHPDNSLLYYTSADTSGRTDLYSYDCKTEKTKRLTETPDREYSPTVTPDKKFISCIIQRENGAQDLGKYPINGGEPTVIINDLTIGYHAWVDDETLILFVLGEKNTLHWFSLPEKKDSVLASDIGRSLHAIPGKKEMSFVQKSESENWTIKKIDVTTRTVSTIRATLKAREDLTWMPDGRILMSDGDKLFYSGDGLSEWKAVELETALPIKGITRLSVNKKGDKVAIVVAE